MIWEARNHLFQLVADPFQSLSHFVEGCLSWSCRDHFECVGTPISFSGEEEVHFLRHTKPEVSHEVLRYYIYTYTWFGPIRTFPMLFIPLDSREIHVWFDLHKSRAFIYTQGQPWCLFHRACGIKGDQRCSKPREHLDQRRLENTCLSVSAKSHAVLSSWQAGSYHSYISRV